MTHASQLLAVQNLVTHFQGNRYTLFGGRPNIRAVDGISFELNKGETLGIVGESGSGKTTLARTILRLQRATSGKVIFDGCDLLTASDADIRLIRRRMQIVFQNPYQALNPRFDVMEVISEAWRVHPGVIPRADWENKAVSLLEQVGLNGAFIRRYPHEFSGGERQRIGIARALALDPELLICDEPVSALDVSVQAQVVNLLSKIQRERRLAMLFVAHDLAVVKHIAQRVAVMYLGKVVEIGSTREVFSKPSHPYTKALLSAVPVSHPSMRNYSKRIVLRGDPPSPAFPPSGCRFRTRCWKATELCSNVEPVMSVGSSDSTKVACHFPERSP
jgi:oligopeptide transport system ATP-binding protein